MVVEKPLLQRGIFNVVMFGALLIASVQTHAEQFGVQVAGGVADHDIKKIDLGLVWDPGLTWWQIDGYHFTAVTESHVSYWDVREANAVRPNIWEFGLTPAFRFIKSSGQFRPYVEAGIGVRLLSHVRETENRTFSSSFQFADMIGVGAQFGAHQQYLAGFRFQHLSNAGLEHPNPGINFSELYLQHSF